MYIPPERVAPADKTRSLLLGIRKGPCWGPRVALASWGGHGFCRRLEVTGWRLWWVDDFASSAYCPAPRATPTPTTTHHHRRQVSKIITELTRFEALSTLDGVRLAHDRFIDSIWLRDHTSFRPPFHSWTPGGRLHESFAVAFGENHSVGRHSAPFKTLTLRPHARGKQIYQPQRARGAHMTWVWEM